MNGRLTAWFPVILLATLALLTYWLNQVVQGPVTKRDGSNRHDPDYMVENFHASRLGPDGQAVHTLSALKMTHFPDDDSTELEQPHFTALDEKRVPLQIVAKSGLVSSNGEDVYFKRNVHVTREEGGGRDWIKIDTESLHIEPEKRVAHTDQFVTITTPTAIITANGMDLNSRTRMVRLLSRVKGHYEKP